MTSPPSIPVHMRRRLFDLDPDLRRLRTQEPLIRITLPRGVQVWVATSHDLIRRVFGDPETFGSSGRGWSDPANGGDGSHPPSGPGDRHGNITEYDPPEHRRLRALLAPEFGARRTRVMAPLVEEIIADQVQQMIDAGPPTDLVESFSMPIPSRVICALLGIPYADRAGFQQRSRQRFNLLLPVHVRQDAERRSRAYMDEFITGQRVDPGEALIGRLVREHGEDIDDRELAGIADILLLGGYETTAHMLSLGTLLLLRNPPYWDMLRAGHDVNDIVEEMLRFLSVVQTGVPRVAHCDVVLAGHHIRAGERVLCSLPSGNRDQLFGENPDSFQPARAANTHLAFGYGIHYCLGASLSRMELRAAFTALATRVPDLRLDPSAGPIRFRDYAAVYGLDSLPVRW
jgi:cytochrome P450